MQGVLSKVLREIWVGTLLFAGALFLVEVLLNVVLPLILERSGQIIAQMPFVREFLAALLGISIEGEITAQLMQAFVWVHPVVLALLWAHEILVCTRFPAGEIDRGTVDMLLALPVSRRRIYGCETLGWLASGACLLLAAGLGYAVGSQAMAPELRPPPASIVLVLFNLFSVYVAVGGPAFLVSSFSERRGRAVFAIFALLLASFLISVLAQFWDPARRLAFLSVLDYYQPAMILRSGAIPWGDILTLWAVGALGWLGGMEITARRSICTT